MLGGSVVATAVLRGGTSSSVHVIAVRLPGGSTVRAVIRRYVQPAQLADEPDVVAREAAVLRWMEGRGVPTPELVAADPTGVEAGVPSLLMSVVPGRVEERPADRDGWLRRLAETLPLIHATPAPPAEVVLPYAVYRQRSDEPPRWTRRPALWVRAVAAARGPVPATAATLLHRDYHPGNVLWRRGRISGVVDWQAAQLGPPAADAGHCRMNLLGRGLECADRFTAHWEEVSGEVYDPFFDLAAIVGRLDDLRDQRPTHAPAIEEALFRALATRHGRPR